MTRVTTNSIGGMPASSHVFMLLPLLLPLMLVCLEDGAVVAAAADGADGDNVWGPFEEDEVDLDTSVGYNFEQQMDPPPELLMPLLPYQKSFLAWAVKQVGGRNCADGNVWGSIGWRAVRPTF